MRHASNVILFSLLIPLVGISQSGWTKKPSNTVNHLIAVKFRTQTDGWAVGSEGTILHTIDGGETWKPDSIEIDGHKPFFWFVEPQDSLRVWAGHWSYPTVRSTDAGESWSAVVVDSTANPRIFFLNPSLGFAVTAKLYGDYEGRILKTTNGGMSWDVIYSKQYRLFYDIVFVDSLFGVAVGSRVLYLDNFDPESIHRTTDGGATWTEIDAPGDGPLTHVSFFDQFVGWACGDNAHLLSTTDGGVTWNQKILPLGGSFSLSSVASPESTEVWVSPALSDELYHSTNTGETWVTEQFPAGSGLTGLFFFDPKHGWAVGESGNIWEYEVMTSVPEISNSPGPSDFQLHNYPNPFNPSTSIRFTLEIPSPVTLCVFDINGRQLTTLLNKYMSSGVHAVTFHAENYPSGVFIYLLSTKTQSSSGKMILSK